jgi:hypothetical protein
VAPCAHSLRLYECELVMKIFPRFCSPRSTALCATLCLVATLATASDRAQRATPVIPLGQATPMNEQRGHSIGKAPSATMVQLGGTVSAIDDEARGVVAGEVITIRGQGFGGSGGTVMLRVQSNAPDARAQLAVQVSHWQDNYISGTIARSSGLGDGLATLVINSSSGAVANNRAGGRLEYPFKASRAEQTLAMNGLGDALKQHYAAPQPQILAQGSGLINAHAVSRRLQAGVLSCGQAAPADKYQLRLSAGFAVIAVNATDLNAGKRHGLSPPGACDVRSSISSQPFSRLSGDGSFVLSPGWDVIDRHGSKGKISGCGSRYFGVTKTPLGFDWDNTGGDRCAANSEYKIESIRVRGPAGVNPLFGTANGVGGALR